MTHGVNAFVQYQQASSRTRKKVPKIVRTRKTLSHANI